MENWASVGKHLRRFTKFQLSNVVKDLQLLSELSPRVLQQTLTETKDFIVEEFIKCIKRTTSAPEAFAQISLLYVYLHKSSRVWTVHKMEGMTVNNETDMTEENLQKSLQRELSRRFHSANTVVQLHDGYFWIRVSLRRTRARNERTTYLVYAYKSTVIGINCLNRQYSNDLFLSLGSVLGFGELSVTALQDKSLEGLFRLSADKENPRVVLNEVRNPLIYSNERDSVSRKSENDVEDMFGEVKKKRQRYASGKYGESPPVLHNITYQLQTTFEGKKFAPRMVDEEKFECQVKIEGPNVIRGLKELVNNGSADFPLPDYLADIRLLGRNKFLIKSRQFSN